MASVVSADSQLSAETPVPMNLESHIVTAANDGKVIALGLGEKLEIRLSENASTGYQWELRGYNKKILSLAGRKSASSSERIGAPGIVSFDFTALRKGETTITARYLRPWEGRKSTVERRTFRVRVGIAAAR